MQKLLFFLFCIVSIGSAQTKTLTGVVSDTLNIPLENANVIANPTGANQQLKFAIADNKGRFRLEIRSKFTNKKTVFCVYLISLT